MLADGRASRPDVRAPIIIRRATLRGNGYPERERTRSRKEREVIVERDRGRCRLCGAKATQIDHIGGLEVTGAEANCPENLQAICDTCHRRKTLEALKPVTPETDFARWARCRIVNTLLDERVHSTVPQRRCDDPLHWRQAMRLIVSERVQQIRDAFRDGGDGRRGR